MKETIFQFSRMVKLLYQWEMQTKIADYLTKDIVDNGKENTFIYLRII